MTLLLRFARAYLEAFLRFFPSPKGNDGLTANERRLMVFRYQLTAGYRPPATEDRLEHLDTLAGKSAGRTWHRPGVEHGAASA